MANYSFKVPNISISTTTYTPKAVYACGCKISVQSVVLPMSHMCDLIVFDSKLSKVIFL